MDPIFSQSFFLSAGETNAESELSLPLLMSKIIDIATAHANSLGIGNPAMEHLGCGWVLSRVAVEMQSYPRVNESYTLTTWVESWNRHFSVRNFSIINQEGVTVGYATSVWMVLNTTTRENFGLAHLRLPEEMICGEKIPIRPVGKHLNIIDAAPGAETPKGTLLSTEAPFEYTFRYTDLDFYRHVNTVRYVSMLLNRFSLNDMDTHVVRRLELSFLRECRYGETVLLRRHDDGLHTSFALSAAPGASDGAELPAAPALFAVVERVPRSFS